MRSSNSFGRSSSGSNAGSSRDGSGNYYSGGAGGSSSSSTTNRGTGSSSSGTSSISGNRTSTASGSSGSMNSSSSSSSSIGRPIGYNSYGGGNYSTNPNSTRTYAPPPFRPFSLGTLHLRATPNAQGRVLNSSYTQQQQYLRQLQLTRNLRLSNQTDSLPPTQRLTGNKENVTIPWTSRPTAQSRFNSTR